jgi:hypothetical protein
VGIQPYPNRIRKITRYGSVTGLAPTELVPIVVMVGVGVGTHLATRVVAVVVVDGREG